MKLSDNQLQKLQALQSCQELKSALAQRRLVPSLPQASKLLHQMNAFAGERKSLRLGIVHTYTSELLDPWLDFSAALNGLDLDIYHAPYGVTVQEAREDSGLARHNPDITLLLLRREDLHPAFQSPVNNLDPADRLDLQKTFPRALEGLLGRFRAAVSGQLIVTFLPDLNSPGLGLYDDMAEHSGVHWWDRIKESVARSLRENFSGTSFLDLEQLVAQVGRQSFFDARLWYSSVFPFSPDGAFALCNAVTTLAASLHHTRAKVIVLDADNTLWGGVIGEDGMNGIALGPDYPGQVYVDFQKRILSYQQRGFILALCSKNNPDDVLEVLEQHPHQVLKSEHFAASRINWLPKPDNLQSIAEELNLGLDSFIFVDDSDYECSAVRHSLKDVDVVQVPTRAVEIPTCLDHLARLEITSLTREDLDKTAMYAQERQRKSQLEALTSDDGNIDDYLRSLNMTMTIGLNDMSHLPRLAQLTQKTNQFNLTTKRYTETDMSAKIEDGGTDVYHFSLADNFGDSGIVGLAIVEQRGDHEAYLDTFLMSCRVIGRRAEQAFLATIRKSLHQQQVITLSAEFIPTRKNLLVESFLPDNGFTPQDDGYTTDLQSAGSDLDKDFPIVIEGPVQE